MSLEQWLVAALATWRIAFMLVYEEGPWGLLYELRKRLQGTGYDPLSPGGVDVHCFWNVFGCVSCMSMWVAAPVLAATWFLPIWIPGAVALSAGAVALERVTMRYTR